MTSFSSTPPPLHRPFIVAFVYLPFGKDIFQAIRFGLETTFVVDDETRAFVENSFSWYVLRFTLDAEM